MGRKRVPLSHQEKWFIANAAQIEKDATIKKIASEIGRSTFSVRDIIIEGGLRNREQILEAQKKAWSKHYFPAHEQIPKIIALLQETKVNKKRNFSEIARICGVSTDFVLGTCEKQKVLSPDELKELTLFFKKRSFAKKHAPYKTKYLEARELLRDTNLLQVQIAKKLGVSERFIIRANKGKGSDKTIRSQRKQKEIKYGLKPINFFSLKQKLELIEPWKKKIAGKLKALNVPQSKWDKIIGFVADSFFAKLDYFDPEKGITVEHFLNAYARHYISHALREKKTVSLERFTTKRGEPTIARAKEPPPPEAAAMREILSKVGNLVLPLDKELLLDQASGMPLRAIGKKHDFSRQTVLNRIRKAKEKISRAFREKNE